MTHLQITVWWLLPIFAVALDDSRRLGDTLQAIQSKLQEEGKKDDDAYDKVGCWCQTQLKEREALNEKMGQDQERLGLDIKEETASNSRMEYELSSHEKDLEEGTSSLDQANAIRKKETDKFSDEEQSHMQSIQQIDAALGALNRNRPVDDAWSLIQSFSSRQLRAGKGQSKLANLKTQLRGRSKDSPDVIRGVLKQMKDMFTDDLKDLREGETSSKGRHEAIVAAKQEEVASLRKQILEKKQRTATSKVVLAHKKNYLERSRNLLSTNMQLFGAIKTLCTGNDESHQTRQEAQQAALVALSSAAADLSAVSFFGVRAVDSKRRHKQLVRISSARHRRKLLRRSSASRHKKGDPYDADGFLADMSAPDLSAPQDDSSANLAEPVPEKGSTFDFSADDAEPVAEKAPHFDLSADVVNPFSDQAQHWEPPADVVEPVVEKASHVDLPTDDAEPVAESAPHVDVSADIAEPVAESAPHIDVSAGLAEQIEGQNLAHDVAEPVAESAPHIDVSADLAEQIEGQSLAHADSPADMAQPVVEQSPSMELVSAKSTVVQNAVQPVLEQSPSVELSSVKSAVVQKALQAAENNGLLVRTGSQYKVRGAGADKVCSAAYEFVREKSWKKKAMAACKKAEKAEADNDSPAMQDVSDALESLEDEIKTAMEGAKREQEQCERSIQDAKNDAQSKTQQASNEANFIGSQKEETAGQIQEAESQASGAQKAKADLDKARASQHDVLQGMRQSLFNSEQFLRRALMEKEKTPAASNIQEAIKQMDKLAEAADSYDKAAYKDAQKISAALYQVQLLSGKVLIPLRLMHADSEEAAVAIEQETDAISSAPGPRCDAAGLKDKVQQLNGHIQRLGAAATKLAEEALR